LKASFEKGFNTLLLTHHILRAVLTVGLLATSLTYVTKWKQKKVPCHPDPNFENGLSFTGQLSSLELQADMVINHTTWCSCLLLLGGVGTKRQGRASIIPSQVSKMASSKKMQIEIIQILVP
jgi:hypothetical protein